MITVDELSLIKEEPVRIKLQAREIEKIQGFVEVFIEGTGYEIKFVPEKMSKPHVTRLPPPPPRHDDEGSDDEEDEDLLGSEDERPRGANNREKESKTMKKTVTGDNHSGRQMGVAGITVMASNKIIR